LCGCRTRRTRPPDSTPFPYTTLFRSMKLARRLAANAPLVMAMLKRFAAATVPQSPVETAGLAWRETERVFRSADYQEGLASFREDRKSTRLNSSHVKISYAVFCLKKK